jgi:hypothetical protein
VRSVRVRIIVNVYEKKFTSAKGIHRKSKDRHGT